MHKLRELALVKLKHILHGVLIGQVRTQVSHELPGEFVEQLRVVVVADVIEVNEASNKVVLQARLADDTISAHQLRPFVVAKELD
jgi:hypothetical protein